MAKRILVPLDRTELAESVMPLAAETARGSGGTVRLLHVAPVPKNLVNAEGRVVAYADQEEARLRAQGMDYLETVAAQLEGIPVERVVQFGDPVSEILREAEEFGADLVVVATAGRRGLGRVLLGSVAEQVFRMATTPVVLFRSGAFHEGVSRRR